mgnify:CR=1 FL=1
MAATRNPRGQGGNSGGTSVSAATRASSGISSTAHVAAASPNFVGLEYHFADAPWLCDLVERDAPFLQNGHLPLTDAPGLGIALNEEICQRYLGVGEALF